MAAVLDEATKARAKGIKLQGIAFADQLAGEMRKHGTLMEDHYVKLKALVEHDSPKEAAFTAMLKRIEDAQNWYKKAEVRVIKRVSKSFSQQQSRVIPLVLHPTKSILKCFNIICGHVFREFETIST